jgi:multidrug efflux pump subunit AcrA (membrane-fusion protein)
VAGFLERINVDGGDRVHNGQTLAVLQILELSAQLKGTGFEMEQVKDDVLRTEQEIKRAEAAHVGYQRLLEASKAEPALVAQQDRDDAQRKDLSSESLADAAKAAADVAREHTEVALVDKDRGQGSAELHGRRGAVGRCGRMALCR